MNELFVDNFAGGGIRHERTGKAEQGRIIQTNAGKS